MWRQLKQRSSYIEVLLATADASRVHSVLPADLSVDHPYLLSLIGHTDPWQQQGQHVEPINVALSKPATHSETEG